MNQVIYQIEEVEKNRVFQFATSNELVYQVNFSPLDFIFRNIHPIKHHAFELSITLINKPTQLRIRNDIKTSATIIAIIKQFFYSEPSNFAIFHIANFDKKSSARSVLFSKWFNKFNDNLLEKYEKTIFDENDNFQISVIIRKDNPSKTAILTFFNDWINETNASK